MLFDAARGARCLGRGLQLIFRPGLRRYVIVPLAVNTLLFAILIAYGATQFADLVDWMLSPLPHWLDWLRYVLWPLFALVTLLAVFFGFSLVANLIGAPFNGMLAEAVERQLTGRAVAQDGDWKRVLRDVVPAILNEIRKIVYMLLRIVPLGLLFFIPVVNLAAPFLWAAFSAWMLAVEYADYPMGNHGLGFGVQRQRLRRRRGLALGFGGATLLATMTPVLNFLVMPAAVAGATILWVENLSGEAAAPTRRGALGRRPGRNP